MTDYLVCKKCGYKQYDPEIVAVYKERYPDMEPHDIPYICGACEDLGIDADAIYDEMREKYDDDPWCGDAVAAAIADVSEDADHDMSDREIENMVYDYIRDVMIQSLWDYIERHKKEIVTDVLGTAKSRQGNGCE